MKKTLSVFVVLLFYLVLLPFSSASSPDTTSTKVGISYSSGRQQMFPFDSRDYIYNTKGIKVIFNHSFEYKKLSLEFQAEPSVHIAEHQLLEELFIQPADGPDYLAKRETFTKRKTILEITGNLGLILRYSYNKTASIYWIGSIGPMYSGTETERLAPGFAFSDVTGIGVSLKYKRIVLDIRPGLRHVSNADLKQPNSGHNSTTLDLGILFCL